jgi:hypothetical protein
VLVAVRGADGTVGGVPRRRLPLLMHHDAPRSTDEPQDPTLAGGTPSRRRQATSATTTRRRVFTKRRRAIAAALVTMTAILGAGLATTGSFGAFTSTVNRTGTARTAVLDINLSDPSTTEGYSYALNQSFGPFAPGSTESRFLGVVNNGTAGSIGSLSVSVTPGTPTGGAGTVAAFQGAITIGIYYCSGTWSPSAPATCTGGMWTSSGVVNSSLGTLATAQALTGLNLSANGTLVGLRLDYTVSAQAATTLQSTRLPVTWNFVATQSVL